MTSPRAIVGSVALLLALPLAIVAGITNLVYPETVVHFTVGIGGIVLAAALFDFRLPAWLTRIGAASIGAFAAIFFFQGLSEVLNNDGLHQIAFNTFGREIERYLPDVAAIWFFGLLALASTGRSRAFGAVLMTTFLVGEIVAIVGPSVGIDFDIKGRLLLPLLWLLVEGAKHGTAVAAGSPVRVAPRGVAAAA